MTHRFEEDGGDDQIVRQVEEDTPKVESRRHESVVVLYADQSAESDERGDVEQDSELEHDQDPDDEAVSSGPHRGRIEGPELAEEDDGPGPGRELGKASSGAGKIEIGSTTSVGVDTARATRHPYQVMRIYLSHLRLGYVPGFSS